MLVYVAFGADEKPFDLIFLSKTNLERFLEACARLGCKVELAVETAGVTSPAVEVSESSRKGVTAPLLSCVGIKEASFRTESPNIVLVFLLRR